MREDNKRSLGEGRGLLMSLSDMKNADKKKQRHKAGCDPGLMALLLSWTSRA
jgi:hypothetical protein